MSWPVPCGSVQAPAKAPVGAPTMNASAPAAAHQRLGPAQVKTVPPNASYAVLQGRETTVERRRRFLCFVKGNWDLGLRFIVKGSDAALKSIAEGLFSQLVTPHGKPGPLVPFTINLTGLVINFFTGKWMIVSLYRNLYYVLVAAVIVATAVDFTPRARRSTRGEGAEKGWFYVAVWMVVPTQLASWGMWRLGRYFDLSAASLGHVRLVTFIVVAGLFFTLGLLGKFPRTERYHIPKGVISDMVVSGGA
jgi:hypothetical protein